MTEKFISTYAKIFIALSSPITDKLAKSAREVPSKASSAPSPLPLKILTSNQVNQALADPHNRALAKLLDTHKNKINADHIIIQGRESARKQLITSNVLLDELKEKIRTNPNKPEIEAAVRSLENKQRLIQNINTAFDHHRRLLSEVSAEIKPLADQHDQEWTDFKGNQLEKLQEATANVLSDAGLDPLLPGEIDNLIRKDSWQDLKDRYYSLEANKDMSPQDFKKIIDLDSTSLADYYKLKAYLAIRSTHPPMENMSRYLKNLAKTFNEIQQDGDNLTQKQIAEIKKLDDRIAPTIKVTNENNSTLVVLEKEREASVMSITSSKDMEKIREKVAQSLAEPTAPKPH